MTKILTHLKLKNGSTQMESRLRKEFRTRVSILSIDAFLPIHNRIDMAMIPFIQHVTKLSRHRFKENIHF